MQCDLNQVSAFLRCDLHFLCMQRQQAVMSSAAIDQVLTSMPGLGLNSHHASALRMLGSLQTLAVSSAEAIVDCTDLEQAQYATQDPHAMHLLSTTSLSACSIDTCTAVLEHEADIDHNRLCSYSFCSVASMHTMTNAAAVQMPFNVTLTLVDACRALKLVHALNVPMS